MAAGIWSQVTVSDLVVVILLDMVLLAAVLAITTIVSRRLGFAKEADHNWQLLGRLGEIRALGHPVLVGASRKSFLGRLLADPATGQPRPAQQRDAATTAVSALAAAQGAWCLRVHDVTSTLDAVRVTARWGAETPA